MFKVGQKIVAKKDVPYRVTCEGSYCEVVEVSPDSYFVIVKLLKAGRPNTNRRDKEQAILNKVHFKVQASHFELATYDNRSALSLLKKGDE